MMGPMGPYMAMPDAGSAWWMVVMAAVWIVPFVLVTWLAVTAMRRESK